MRILFTQRELILRAGSEMFTIEAARELQRRGHEVVVWSPRNGELATALEAYRVPVKTSLQDIPWRPDVIHGQHHMQTMAALAFFYGTPVIYHCHGRPWIATPPLHRLIRQYVIMTSAMRDSMETTFGIPGGRLTTIRNFVNLQRFSRTRTPPPQIRRAVVFDNNFFPGREMEHLRTICGQEGIELDTVGLHFGNSHPRPEHLLQEYDLAFAIGKCAMEAVACGCAVIPLAPGLAGSMILPDTFARWASSNFAPRTYSPANCMSADWLREELARYRPEAIAETTRMLRASHTVENAVTLLEEVYQKAVQDSGNPPTPETDLRETGLYLEKFGQHVDLMYAEAARDSAVSQQNRRDAALFEQDALNARQALQEDQLKKEALRSRITEMKGRLRELERRKNDFALKWNTAVEVLRRSLLGRWCFRGIRRRLRSRAPGQTQGVPKPAAEG